MCSWKLTDVQIVCDVNLSHHSLGWCPYTLGDSASYRGLYGVHNTKRHSGILDRATYHVYAMCTCIAVLKILLFLARVKYVLVEFYVNPLRSPQNKYTGGI